MFALGMAAGPVVGGLLLDRFWWGAAFLVALPMMALLIAGAPFLLPEYRAPRSGRLDLASVCLSLLALLPVIYGIKQIAKDGVEAGPLLAILAGVAFGLLFIRRQRRLPDPHLDMELFSCRAFSVALVVLLFGLVAVGGTMLLVTQYLQLVAGFSPLVAGLWMGPPALAMVVAGVTAPLIARRIRPGLVVAAALGLSALGYLMLAGLDGGASSLARVVTGFSLAYLGLGTIAALGTELVVGAAPAEKAGSASALSETVQDLGVALGIAALGSLATAVYRKAMPDRIPEALPEGVRQAVGDSLWAASSVGQQLPDGLLEEARAAFALGFNAAAVVSAATVTVLALLAALALRDIGTAGSSE